MGAGFAEHLFHRGDEGEEPIFQLDLASGQRSYIARRGAYGDLHLTPDNTHMVASRNMVRRPAEVTLLNLTEESVPRKNPVSSNRAAKEPTLHLRRARARRVPLAEPSDVTEQPLTRLNRTLLTQLDLPDMEHYWFRGSGGVRVEGFLIRPPGFDPEKKYPVKFLIHGGPQGAWGDGWSYRWNAELFAADGYVVVMVNPRGSTGYGQAFMDGVNGDWGGKPYIDLMRGLDARSSIIFSSTRRASAPWARATAASWRTGFWATRTASAASSRTMACSIRSRHMDPRMSCGSTNGSFAARPGPTGRCIADGRPCCSRRASRRRPL